jgi:hypothetical protein
MKSMKKLKIQKTPEVVMWRGIGILSSRGTILYGCAKRGSYILRRLETSSPGSRLVQVLARLERVTRRQVMETQDDDLGIVSPEAPKIKASKVAVS